MSFMPRIVDRPDAKQAALKELTSTRSPIYMYGAGSYATDVTAFLKKHHIAIDGFVIDNEYLKPGVTMQGMPIRGVEDLTKSDPMQIIIGFSDYISARKKLEKLYPNAKIHFIDAPNQDGFFDYEYIQKHQAQFEETYEMLADQKSKDIFETFINAKICGDPSGLYPFAEFNQYFCDVITLQDDEVFVDCGAYDGDTVLAFAEATKSTYKKIHTLEPDKKNYKKLLRTIADNNLKNVQAYNQGAWSEKTQLHFSAEANMGAFVSSGGTVVDVDTIDAIVGQDEVTYIKMDIEGAELAALRGGEKTIRKHAPKLAICAYHKPEDLITIPQYILSLNPGYKLYLRHHQHMSWEMVLYAVAE